jgi:hypothetical protein
VVGYDTDLWFHLNYGQYIAQHGTIPQTSFYSFIDPPRIFVLYFWLFDVLVYAVHTWSGYGGLLVLRGLLYAALMAGVIRLVFRGVPGRAAAGWSAALVVLSGLILLPRYLLIRPHMFTYLFLVAFLYILEYRRDRAWALPVIGVLWCNLHGIAYPIMLLVLAAYGAELYLPWGKRDDMGGRARRQLLWAMGLAAATVFATPHHLRLPPVPFFPVSFESSITQEFRQPTLGQLSTFAVMDLRPTNPTVFNAWLWASGFTVLAALARRRARVSHLLLYLGGIGLLARGIRFTNEFTLLALPLMAAHPLISPGEAVRRRPLSVVSRALAAVLMVMPVLTLGRMARNRPAYPFSTRQLPQGVVQFLTHVGTGGRLLNYPNAGGYLRWMLYPQYRIFRDMEVFDPPSLYLALTAFRDPAVLHRILAQYDPTYITVPVTIARFPEMIEAVPDYVPVFFDDFEVLYVNRRQEPHIARQYALEGLDPFQFTGQDVESLLADDRLGTDLIERLKQMLAIHPEGGVTNQLLALAALQDQDSPRALLHADRIIRVFPESPTGYLLRGDIMQEAGRPREAIACYRQGLARSSGGGWLAARRKLGAALCETGRSQQASRMLNRTIDVLDPATTLEDAYLFGRAARLSGHRQAAQAVFVFLKDFKVAPDDAAWTVKVDAELQALGLESTPIRSLDRLE